MVKLNFQHHYSGLQCHMNFQKSNADLMLKNIYSIITVKKSGCLIFFVKTVIFFMILHLFKIENFCNKINVLIVTFDKFNESL